MIKPEDTGRQGATPPAEGDDRGFVSRRGLLGSAVAALLAGTLASDQLVQAVAADAAVSELSVADDAITTDNGQLTGLTVSVDSHVSYDGLDTEAETVEIELYAASSGGATDIASNRIASASAAVADESKLGTFAGHHDVAFADVDVLAADDLSKGDFSATGDGTSKDTDVEFRLAMAVSDGAGNALVDAAASATATISVTNEGNSAGAGGNGNTNAQGTNQSP